MVGRDHDGRPRVHYRQEPPDPSKPVLYAGPVSGPVELADGTVYEVSPDWVETASHAHAGELSHRICVRHEEEGHPLNRPRTDPGYDPLRDEFHHTCTDACGPLARSPEEQEAAFEQRLQRLGYGHLVGTLRHVEKLAHLALMRARANGQEG